MPRQPRERRRRPPAPTETPPPATLSLQLPGWLDDDLNDQAAMLFYAAGIPTAWPVVAAHLGTYVIRYTALANGIYGERRGYDGTALLVRDLSTCRDMGIRIAINVPTRYRCDGRESLLAKIADQLGRVKRLGFTVDSLQFQSAISGTIHTDDCLTAYPKGGGASRIGLANRLDDLADGMAVARAVFPAILGVVADTAAAKDDPDHSADWDIERDYTAVVERFDREDLPTPTFHLAWEDTEVAPDLSDVKRALRLCRALGARVGIKPIVPAVATAAGYVSRYDAFVRRLWAGGAATWPDECHVTAWNREASGTMVWPESSPDALFSVVAGWCRDQLIARR